jgi:hypothetical protein
MGLLNNWGQSKNSVLNLLRLWDFTLTPNIGEVEFKKRGRPYSCYSQVFAA